MPFTPIEFAKLGEANRFAYSAAEYVELVFAGWHPTGEGAPPVDTVSPQTRAALQALEDELKAGVVPAGDTFAELYALILAGGGGGGGGPIDADDITDATTVGRGLIRATNAAAARSIISAITSAEASALDSTLEASLTALINARQPGDPDLTTLASLNSSADRLIQSVSGTWSSRTPAQVKATLALAQADIPNLVSDLAGKAPSSHTHPSSQITDFTEAVQDVVGALLASGTGVNVSYDDAGNLVTITATGGGGSTDPEVVRDTIGTALVGVGNITVTVNDAGDTITISTAATANSTDAQLRDRGTHSGQQAFSTISDGTEAVQDIVGAFLAAGTGITVTYNDAGNVATIATTITQYTDEMARDALGAALAGGTGITVTPNDAGDSITIAVTTHTHTASNISDFTEAVQDVVGALLSDGTGIDVVYNDSGNIVSINSTVTQYTDEQVRDVIAAALVAGANTTITPNDAGDTITIASTGGGGAADTRGLPSHAGTTSALAGPYDARLNLFNGLPQNMRRIRAGQANAQGGGLFHVVVTGDSLGVGSEGAGAPVDITSYPQRMGRTIADAIGVREAGGINCPVAYGGQLADGWSTTGSVTKSGPYLILAPGSTATFKSRHRGKNIAIYLSDDSVSSPGYSIDGAADVPISAGPGGTGLQKISAATSTDTVHSVTVKGHATTGNIKLLAISVMADEGVAVHNLCYGGTAAAWTAGTSSQNWTNTAATDGVYWARKLLFDESGITPHLHVINIGANDLLAGRVTPANAITGAQAMGNWWAGDVMQCQSWEVTAAAVSPGTNMTDWNTYRASKYDLCDTEGWLLLDWSHRYGNGADVLADGIVAADQIHPKHGTASDMGVNAGFALCGGGSQYPRIAVSDGVAPHVDRYGSETVLVEH